jgi:drug/metabolite transporter (DMT)-like permease
LKLSKPPPAKFRIKLLKIDRFTAAGLLAVLVWSSTVAVSRSLSEDLGPLATGAAIYTLGGALACLAETRSKGGLSRLVHMPRPYLLGCGALFVGYMALLYLALGLARTRAEVIAVGLANYLWPSLILVFSLPILHKRARIWLAPGLLLALAGTGLAAAGGDLGQLVGLVRAETNWLPVALAVGAAVLWGLYSNLARRWGPAQGSAVPLFLLVSGLVFTLLHFLTGEISAWSWNTALVLLYMALFPAWLGYRLWDEAMQRGDLVLVTSLSYFTPLLSTLVSLLVLQVPLTPQLGLAALLVTAGAALSRLGVVD